MVTVAEESIARDEATIARLRERERETGVADDSIASLEQRIAKLRAQVPKQQAEEALKRGEISREDFREVSSESRAEVVSITAEAQARANFVEARQERYAENEQVFSESPLSAPEVVRPLSSAPVVESGGGEQFSSFEGIIAGESFDEYVARHKGAGGVVKSVVAPRSYAVGGTSFGLDSSRISADESARLRINAGRRVAQEQQAGFEAALRAEKVREDKRLGKALITAGLGIGSVGALGLAGSAVVGEGVLTGTAGRVASSGVGRFGLQLLGGYAASKGVGSAVEGVTLLTGSEAEKRVMADSRFEGVVEAGFRAEEAQIVKEGGGLSLGGVGLSVKGVARELPGGVLLVQRDEAFSRAVREELVRRGFSGVDLEVGLSAAERARTARGGREVGEALGISVASEYIGGQNLARSIAKKPIVTAEKGSFGSLFKRYFGPIGRAGMVEGSVSELNIEESRGRDVSVGRVALSGGAGFLTAGLIGGTIAGLAPTRSTASNVVKVGAYLTDPYEYPGDVVEAGLSRVVRKTGLRDFVSESPRVRVRGGVLSVSSGSVGVPASVSGGSSGGVSSFVGSSVSSTSSVPVPVGVPVSVPSSVPVPVGVPVSVPSSVPVSVPSSVPVSVPSSVPVSVPSSVPVSVPSSVPVNVPSDVPSFINVNTDTDTNTDVPVNTDTPVSIFTNVPVTTPLLRVPPPLPLGLNSLGGAGGVGKRVGRRKYVNELFASQVLFSDLVGAGPRRTSFNKVISVPGKSKTKKRTNRGGFNPRFRFF